MNSPTSQAPKSTNSTDLSARDLLAPLFRRKKLLGLIFVGMSLVTVVVAVMASSLYESKMEVLVNRQRLDPMVSAEPTFQTPPTPPPLTEEEVNSEIELLKSGDLLRETVLANNLQYLERGTLSAALFSRGQDNWYVSKAVDRLSKKLDVSVVTKTNVIEVRYKSKSPEIAYGVLKKIADLYMQKHLAVQRPDGSFDFFDKETERYREALAGSEQRLADFGKAQGAVPEVESTGMAQQVVNSVANLHRAHEAIAADKERIRTEQAQMEATPARSATMAISNDASILLQQLMAK